MKENEPYRHRSSKLSLLPLTPVGAAIFPNPVGQWLTKPISLRHYVYALTLGSIALGYYGYWALWKLKIYYFGWTVAFLIALVFACSARRYRQGLLKSFWPIVVWGGYLTLSTFWSPDPNTSRYFLTAGVILPMAFLIGHVWSRTLTQWRRSTAFIILPALQLPIVVWTLFTMGKLFDESLGAVRSGIAGGALILIPFLVWRARSRRSRGDYFWIVLAMLVLAGTGSRSAPVIGIVVLLGTLTFVQPPRGLRARAFTRAALLISFLAALATFLPLVRSGAVDAGARLSTQTDYGWRSWTNRYYFLSDVGGLPADLERRAQMLVSVESFLAHPIRGNGYYSTYVITDEMFGSPVGAHGLVSLLLGETGLIGLGIFSWLVWKFFRRTKQALQKAASQQERGFWATCRWTMVAMLLYGLFQQIDQSPSLFVLLAWGYGAVPDRES
jgi:hypothetical protein